MTMDSDSNQISSLSLTISEGFKLQLEISPYFLLIISLPLLLQ